MKLMAQEKLFYVGVKALIENEVGKVLVLEADVTYKHKSGMAVYWDLPGGRIDVGDDLLSALGREIKEETGITEYEALPDQVITVLSNHEIPLDGGGKAGLALIIYRVKIADDAVITLSPEHTNYEWVDRAEAAERLRNKYPQAFTDAL
jgi:8-oxo-dGTP pyrophosphatase MutT (NUDIX family)